jgi:hypothetical protein
MIDRDVRVLLCPDLSVPVTYGMVRPTILLPVESKEWSDAEIIAAMIHELEHVRRGDWIVQLSSRAIAIAYWPNPLVWLALRRLALEAERAADDAVVRRSERPSAYAEQLVALARQVRGFGLPALAMATPGNLAQRVEAILDSTRRRGGRSMRQSLAALFAVVIVAVVIAPLQLVGSDAGTAYDQAVEDGVAGGIEDGVAEGVETPFGSAMIEAARAGRLNHIRQLLDSGVSPNVVVHGDGTPLIAAADEGHADIVQLLLDRNADPNLAVSGDGNPLIAAAREGHLEIVKLLLDRGAQVNAVVPGDENPLIQASRNGHVDVVTLLLARGADANAQVWANRSPQGELRTPLIMARRGGHARVVEILRQAGARQ